MRDLRLLDTLPALIVTYTAFNLPFVIWLLIGFYEELPIELERAAMIDGCSVWMRFRKIVLPLSAPALVATAILSAVLAWNEFLFAVMLTRVNAKTLPVVMSGFITDKGTQWDQMTALGVITVLPVLVFALAVQRYLVRGLTLGAVKEWARCECQRDPILGLVWARGAKSWVQYGSSMSPNGTGRSRRSATSISTSPMGSS